MRLSQASDFALRILMTTAQTDGPQTVDKLATQLGLAKSHVMKIVAHLAKGGYLETTRGRGGGIRLAKPPEEIRLGDVVRLIEPDLGVVACLKPDSHDKLRLPAKMRAQRRHGTGGGSLSRQSEHTDACGDPQPARLPEPPGLEAFELNLVSLGGSNAMVWLPG